MYYYFWKNKKILETRIPLPAQFNPSVVELTPEQVEFYLANPTATIQEVMNCALTSPYVPPEPDVQEYVAQKVKDLQDACYGSISITSLEYAIAEDKVNNVLADSFYTLTEANQVLSDFRSQSKKAMNVYKTYKPRIESASSIEAVDTVYNQAMEAL